jgi:hypothetical protein
MFGDEPEGAAFEPSRLFEKENSLLSRVRAGQQ